MSKLQKTTIMLHNQFLTLFITFSEENNPAIPEVLTIENLPDEVLEKILLYLPGYDIPELAFVSKRFDEVISRSVKLMDNFEVNWENEYGEFVDMSPLLVSKRKYRKLQIIAKEELDLCLKFVSNNSKTLTKISLFDCTVKSQEIRDMLTSVAENLQEFNMCAMNITNNCDNLEPINMPELNNMEIMYGCDDGYPQILSFFKGSKVTIFNYEDDYEMSADDMKIFATFLLSLKDLKNVSLSSNVTLNLFADDQFSSSVKFSLEKVYMIFYPKEDDPDPVPDIVFAKMLTFLRTQRGTLRTLTLLGCKMDKEIIENLLRMELNDLRLVSSDFGSGFLPIAVKNSTVTRIFISSHEDVGDTAEAFICSILESCVNIKAVDFACVDITFEIALVIAYKMEKFEAMKLYNCTFIPQMSFPSMKSLEFSRCKYSHVVKMIRVNPRLQKLKVPNSYRNKISFQAVIHGMSIDEISYE